MNTGSPTGALWRAVGCASFVALLVGALVSEETRVREYCGSAYHGDPCNPPTLLKGAVYLTTLAGVVVFSLAGAWELSRAFRGWRARRAL